MPAITVWEVGSGTSSKVAAGEYRRGQFNTSRMGDVETAVYAR